MKKFLTLSAMVTLLFIGCKKDDDPTPTPTPTPAPAVNINSSPRATFKLDGTAVSIIEGSNVGTFVGTHTFQATWPDTSQSAYSVEFANATTLDYMFTVEKGTLKYPGFPADDAVFTGFFPTGSFSYAELSNLDQNGIVIAYYLNGEKWSTDQGSQDQTGSTFTIADRVIENDAWGEPGVKVLANFKCKLYDSSGSVKDITDGTFIGYFAR